MKFEKRQEEEMNVCDLEQRDLECFLEIVSIDMIREKLNKKKKGFRRHFQDVDLAAVNNDELFVFIVENKSDQLIHECLNEAKKQCLDDIDMTVYNNSPTPNNREFAIAEALSNSIFKNNIDLYLLLSNHSDEMKLKIRRITEHSVRLSQYRPREYDMTSVCISKSVEGTNSRYLKRIADVQEDGSLIKVGSSSVLECTQDLNKECRGLEVWHWKNDGNETRSECDENLALIPIIFAKKKYKDIKQFIEKIKFSSISNRLIVQFESEESIQTTLLLEADGLERLGENWKIRNDISYLTLLEINADDKIELNSKIYYNNVFITAKTKRVSLLEPNEIISVLLKKHGFSSSIPYNQNGSLAAIDLDTLYHEIALECCCSIDEAKQYYAKYYTEFLKEPENDISADVADDQIDVIESEIEQTSENYNEEEEKIIVANETLESINNQIAKRQEELEEVQRKLNAMKESSAEHQCELDMAKEQLVSLNEQIKVATQTNNDLNQKLLTSKEQLQVLEDAYAEKLALADDVERKIRERMKKAQCEVADFLAERAIFGFTAQSPLDVPDNISTNNVSMYQDGIVVESDDVDEIKTASDLVSLLKENMENAGVADGYSGYVAKLLYAAYCGKKHLLIAGPNANDIIDAFSITLLGKHPGWLDINGSYDPKTIEKLKNCNDQIIGIKNLFHNEWIAHLPEIINDKSKIFVVSHPFSEDLCIEPKGLFNYLLPLVTDMLISDEPKGNYVIGKCNKDFLYTMIESTSSRVKRMIKDIQKTPLLAKNIFEMAETMTKLGDRIATEKCLSFAIMSYSEITGQGEQFMNFIRTIDIESTLIDLYDSIFGEL